MKTRGAMFLLTGSVLCAAAAAGPVLTPTEQPEQIVVRHGVIVLKVPDYDAARKAVEAAGARNAASVIEARTDVTEKGRRHGLLKFQLPAAGLNAFLNDVRPAGTLFADAVQSEDHNSEYESLALRAGRLHQHADRLDGVLRGDRRLRGSDILFIQDRLFRAGLDESLLGQDRVDLKRAAQTATLQVTLFEPGAEPAGGRARVRLGSWFHQSLGRASVAANRTIARGLTLAAYLIVYAPALLAALACCWLLWRRLQVWAAKLRSSYRPGITVDPAQF